MSRRIICTVGTSLLTNRSDDRPWGGWRPGGELPDERTVENWMETATDEKISAETNTLSRLDLSEGDFLVLLHSATPEGRFCADRLKRYLGGRIRSASLEEIGRLGYGARQFTAGLKSLVDIALKHVGEARERGSEPVFCATGGFKAEIAFLNVLGALLSVDVYYLHEKHRELVLFPRFPLKWDTDFAVKYEDFFKWVEEEPRRTHEVESWLKRFPELRSLVENTEDGFSFLTAAGLLLYKAAMAERGGKAPATWPESTDLPPEKKNHLSGSPHHRPTGWEKFVEQLCETGFVTSVRYDSSARGGGKVRLVDPEEGTFAVRYERGGQSLALLVTTTARGEAQCELVAGHFRRML